MKKDINKKTPDLIIIFGPQAVGKMTVAQKIAESTDYRVFHNHMTIDMLTKVFEYGTPAFNKLRHEFRVRIVEESLKQDKFKGLIFTYVWDLNSSGDKQEIDDIKDVVESGGGSVCFIELEADLDERKSRNRTENRIAHKDKSNIEFTEKNIIQWNERFKLNSDDDFFYPERHLKINNTSISASEVASKVIHRFGLELAYE